MIKKLSDKIRKAILNWLGIKLDLEALWEVTSQAYETGEKHSRILGKNTVDIEQLWDVVRMDHQTIDKMVSDLRQHKGVEYFMGMDAGREDYSATVVLRYENGKYEIVSMDIKENK
jgi:hypothetical protein